MTCNHPFIHNGLLLPCGKCTACRISKASEWTQRIQDELVFYKEAIFTTLTYDDQHIIETDYQLQKADLQKFLKRLRKDLYPRKIKYFACGEYGEKNERPHYHLIILGMGVTYGDKLIFKRIVGVNEDDIIQSRWKKGYVYHGTVTRDSIRYTVDYIHKKYLEKYKDGTRTKPFQLVSKGMGKEYALKYKDRFQKNGTRTIRGNEVALPRYYVNLLDIDEDVMKKRKRERRKEIFDNFKENNAIYLHGVFRPIISQDLIDVNKWKQAKLDAFINLKAKGNL